MRFPRPSLPRRHYDTTVLNVGLTNGLTIGRSVLHHYPGYLVPTEPSIPKNSTQPFPPVYGSQRWSPYVRGPHRVSQKSAQAKTAPPASHRLHLLPLHCVSATALANAPAIEKHQRHRSDITLGHREPKSPVGVGEFDETPKST
ncbi:BQ5605_C001g00477 [Microbotryum silenes-dioicae]|uniref:BQ5605_C001g00477 protein n=1 Tax=Microbotryum silenes-dioicae TaxID=796604 RepID=A0A2X0M7L7_9BASI|nr:BQ5605_C001g00477 [Microbotryum silenes-dioicae]